MRGQETHLWSPGQSFASEPRKFTFDHCFWSFDGFLQLDDGYCTPDPEHEHGALYADQERVYKDLGREVVRSAWQGYNAALLAYGQSGSGKSYSMVELSMMEIYNESVFDLLVVNKGPRKGLKVREHPKKGFFELSQIKRKWEEDMQAVIKENETQMLIMKQSYEEKLKSSARKERTDTEVTVDKGCPEAKILVNGSPVTSPVTLRHNDRIVFGQTQLFLFVNPRQHDRHDLSKYPEVTYEMAQEEIALRAGIKLHDDDSLETALLNRDMIEVLPKIDEANAMSAELDRGVHFEILLVSPQLLGKQLGRTEVYVKAKYFKAEQEFDWTKEKFLSRVFAMKEMYSKYENGEQWEVDEERDPFLEDPNTEVRIGTVQVYLQPLAYMVDLKEQLEIINFKGEEVGIINVEMIPCSETGHEYTEHDNVFLDSPGELVGRDLNFIVRILHCRSLPKRFTDIRCKYRMFKDQEDTVTEAVSGTSDPDFNHTKSFSYRPATVENVDPNKQSIIVELLLMKKQQARQNQKLSQPTE
ncbi:hypothetical protein HPB52_010915 [Rhipicephalus sanguineus]|uniref:Kinesin motor domain-containing protein n=1 Tax=Rhipicephalus sanguineus TaxID=34632 RepID=A0A9D4PR99_RHISA|nr:hypothetical protein HPB52_010915 [Rhipicephalus sanguineus]